jgi:hypothetical protein
VSNGFVGHGFFILSPSDNHRAYWESRFFVTL